MDNVVTESNRNEEKPSKTRRVPKSVYFILGNIFLERFSSLGTSGILPLFLNRKLNFSQNASTAIFHSRELLAFIFPIFGAIIADSWWGHFKTILCMIIVFFVGSVILALGAIESWGLPILAISIIGIFISVIGSGSTRANFTAFGANQYRLPEEGKQLTLFFSLNILCIKLGSFVGRLSVPIIKEEVKCFGQEECYPLAYGVTAVAAGLGMIMVITGKRFSIIKPPGGNMLVKVIKCMMTGISEKLKSKNADPKEHWLDYAEEKCGSKLVIETKNVIKILILYLPIPAYWAAYQLQFSRWVFQATNMNGNVGFYTIKADQIGIVNPVLGIIAIPLNDYILYPLLAKIRITTLLQKMLIGGILNALSSVAAGLVQIQVDKSYLHMYWLLPQFAFSALSENFMYNSHLSFAYNEAPESMKSVMTSFVFITIAIGNALVMIVSGGSIFESQAVEFFFFGGLLFVAMIPFAFLAKNYKPVKQDTTGNNSTTLCKIDIEQSRAIKNNQTKIV